MKAYLRIVAAQSLVWIVSTGIVVAQGNSVTQVDWDTRSASCPAKVTQSTSVTIRVTHINDLLIDFETGDTAQYQLRAKGSPVSVVPPQNPFALEIANSGNCGNDTLAMTDTKREANSKVVRMVLGT